MRPEHRQAVKHSLEVARKRERELHQKQISKTMTRAESFELDMTIEIIRRGEEMLMGATIAREALETKEKK